MIRGTRRQWRWSVIFALAVTLVDSTGCSGAGAGGEVSVGTQGASFSAGDAWQRKELSPDMGKDQFKLGGRKECYALVLEVNQVVEGERELASVVRERMREVTNRPVPQGTPSYRKRPDGAEQTTQVFEGTYSGMRLGYALSLISQAGLTYQVMIWAPQSQLDRVEDLSERMIDGFSMPPAGSEWRRGTRPTEHVRAVGGYELKFRYRPALLRPSEEPSTLISLVSADGGNAIHVLEMPADDADQQLDEVLEAVNEGEANPFEPIRREDVQVGGVKGRMLTSFDGTLTGVFLALPLERGASLDVRYLYTGRPEASRFDRDLFLESLSLDKIDVGLELPEVPSSQEELYRNPFEVRVAGLSDQAAKTSLTSMSHARRLPDGRVLLMHGSGVLELDNGAERKVIDGESWGKQYTAAVWSGGLLIADANDPKGELLDADGEPTAAPIRARVVADWGERLLYCPPAPAPALIGYAAQPSGGEVRCLYPDGSTKTLAEVKGFRVSALGAEPGSGLALAVATPAGRADVDWRGQRPVLALINLESGAHKTLAEWESASAVAPAGKAWLVTGTPQDGPAGVYLVSSGGKRKTLLTGNRFHGVAVESGRLWYAGPVGADEGERLAVFSAPLREVAEVGPLCQPFCVTTFNQLAERWSAKQRTAEDAADAARIATRLQVRQAFAAGSALCEEQLGRPLPVEAKEVDAMLQTLMGNKGLSQAAKQLAAVTLTHFLLEQGAEWVESDRGAAIDWVGASYESAGNTFAEGYTPASLLTDTLYNDDGYWAPATTIIDAAGGRRLFVSLDAEMLHEAVERAKPSGIEAVLSSPDPARLVEVLESAPANTSFRKALYQQVAATGGAALLREVAGHFVGGDHEDVCDRIAWLSARQRLADKDPDTGRLADDLISAISEHPSEPVFYVLLGAACEVDPGRGAAQSRLCYSRALEMRSWGDLADTAQERLEAIEDAMADPTSSN
ncbi:hypothetical protein Pla123a_14320 [Posidoniimonas polymericola]|uniref:Uncharacterized protein n=1 Tax=Posidoniimonas polymericola TaxID=2528002 RepID=A0A5C5YRV4_9BACT|nr:hypothetical protein [Posidoniimonas polymericola]TWT77636.1 hypothetical protein Pla123a_14320 [Posidoniimonas polymericola]